MTARGRPPRTGTERPRPPTARASRAAIRREQLLQAALELFCEHGFAATSTRRIADAAGVTEGLIFHYFPNKEAILFELVSRQDTFAGRVAMLVQRAAHGSVRELLAAVAEGFGDATAQEAALIGFLSAEAQVNPALRARIAAGNAVMHQMFVQLLARGVASGELRQEASLSATAYGFFGGFASFFAENRELGGEAWRREASAFARAWADQCWRGIATLDALGATAATPKRPRATKR